MPRCRPSRTGLRSTCADKGALGHCLKTQVPSGSPSIKRCDVRAMWSRSRASQEHQPCCKHAADSHGGFCASCLWLSCLLLAVTCGWQMLSLCPGIWAHQIAWRQLSRPWVRHGHQVNTWTCRSHHGAVPWHCVGILGKDGGSPQNPQHGCRAQSTRLWVPLIKGKKFQSTAPLPKDERASPYSSRSPQQLAAEPTLML